MIKKITAYSFFLIANIVFLAHAVIPHHHHELQVCIEHTNCDNNVPANAHNSTKHNHHHGSSDNTTCLLKQAAIIPSSQQGKLLKDPDHCSDTHNHDFFILSNFGYEDLQPVSVTVATVPEFHSFLISFVTTSLGLRAPPIV